MLSPDETRQFDQIPDFIRIGIIGDGSCFFHCIFYALCSAYREASLAERKVFVDRYRQNLSEDFKYEEWERLGRGELSKFMTELKIREMYNLSDSDDEKFECTRNNPNQLKQVATAAFRDYLNILRRGEVGDEVFDIVHRRFGINILLIDGVSGQKYSVSSKQYDNYICILWLPGHFECLGRVHHDGTVKVLFKPAELSDYIS